MKPDLLDEATAAFRDATHEALGDRGLDRLQRALEKPVRSARSRRAAWWVLPLAAALLVGTAWAGASGTLRRWFGGQVETVEPPAPPPEPALPRFAPSVPGALVSAQADPIVVPVTSAVLPRASHAVPASKALPPTAAVDLDALYREAHEAQFKRRDPTAALAAWNRYLGSADSGARLLLEARYNRGLVLHELGRDAEARAALKPFAEGDYGRYRQDEAALLLQSLH